MKTLQPGMPLLTAARMRDAERVAMESGTVTGRALMERAATGVVDAIVSRWPDRARAPGRRALVLCGPGNNGGDGFAIARLLHARGWLVAVRLLGDPSRLPPDARANHDAWCAIGGVEPLAPSLDPVPGDGPGLVVDALFGTGLSRPLEPALACGLLSALDAPAFADWRRVAVDVPSGLCADSGRVLAEDGSPGHCLRADLTVTFHAARPGHVLADGPALCGAIVVAPLGLPDTATPARLAPAPDPAGLRKSGGHKYGHGHALVLAGGSGRTGAARLAARAALRIGAGLVTLGVPGSALQECAAQVTAVMLQRADGAETLGAVLDDRRLNAVCIGPGLGMARARSLVPVVLDADRTQADAPRRAVVLDADALTAFEDSPERLFAMLHGSCILTPHDGEFARLFPDLAQGLAAHPVSGPAPSRMDAASRAAARAGCVVVLKGPDTVIAEPGGGVAVHSATGAQAVPWLATAGSGDVLAGLATGLLARGHPAWDAAQASVALHAAAARLVGPGLIAEDLPEALPGVLRALGV